MLAVYEYWIFEEWSPEGDSILKLATHHLLILLDRLLLSQGSFLYPKIKQSNYCLI